MSQQFVAWILLLVLQFLYGSKNFFINVEAICVLNSQGAHKRKYRVLKIDIKNHYQTLHKCTIQSICNRTSLTLKENCIWLWKLLYNS